MSDHRDPDAWLVGANKGWRDMAHAERGRANLAERRMDREHYRYRRMRSTARDWRSATVLGWALLFAQAGVRQWHWPTWSYFPVVLGIQAVNTVVYAWQVRRPHGLWSWKVED